MSAGGLAPVTVSFSGIVSAVSAERSFRVRTRTVRVVPEAVPAGKVSVPAEAGQEEILAAAKADAGVRPWVEGKTVVKELYVKGKLVNFVVK